MRPREAAVLRSIWAEPTIWGGHVDLVHAAAASVSVAWAVEMHTKRSFEAFPQMTGSSSERTFIPGAANDRSPPGAYVTAAARKPPRYLPRRRRKHGPPRSSVRRRSEHPVSRIHIQVEPAMSPHVLCGLARRRGRARPPVHHPDPVPSVIAATRVCVKHIEGLLRSTAAGAGRVRGKPRRSILSSARPEVF